MQLHGFECELNLTETESTAASLRCNWSTCSIYTLQTYIPITSAPLFTVILFSHWTECCTHPRPALHDDVIMFCSPPYIIDSCMLCRKCNSIRKSGHQRIRVCSQSEQRYTSARWHQPGLWSSGLRRRRS